MMLLAAVWLRTGQWSLPIPGLAGWLATALRQEGASASVWPAEILPASVFLYVLGLWPFFLYVFGAYDGRRNTSLKAELLNVLLAVSVATLTLAGLLFFSFRGTSRLLILEFFVLDVVLLAGGRVGWWAIERRGAPAERRRRVLLVGGGPLARRHMEHLLSVRSEVDLIGHVADESTPPDEALAGIPRLGSLGEAWRVAQELGVHYVVVALPWNAFEQIGTLYQALQAHGVRVYVAPDLETSLAPGQAHMDLSPNYGVRRLVKRVLDVLGATVGLVLCAPLLVVVALAVKLDSRGPVLYRQQRVGENGQPFTMLKFRTMQAGADTRLHQAHVARLITENLPSAAGEGSSLKLAGDPRITRVGAILRKTSLDELPQLLNVLTGEMSLVGPRPPLAYEVALYQDWHKRRLAAPPGMTGLWQVRGRNRVNFDEMVRMDLHYIDQQSVWLDLQLLIQTPLAVVTGRGAG